MDKIENKNLNQIENDVQEKYSEHDSNSRKTLTEEDEDEILKEDDIMMEKMKKR